MHMFLKNNPSGFVGHTISQFILYSYQKLEDSREFDEDKDIEKYFEGKTDVSSLEDEESEYINENDFNLTNSDDYFTNTDDDRFESYYNQNQSDLDIYKYEDIERSKDDNKSNGDRNYDFSELKHYKDYAKLENMKVKNDVGYNRFISKIRLDEARSVIYGTWDAEQSELMWNEINGEEKDTDIIFNDSQIVREEDLLKSKKKPEVTLLTDHLVDYISYVNIWASERTKSKFKYNRKYVLLFGGAQLNGNNFHYSYQNLLSMINGNVNFEFSNNLYYSEAQSFRSRWEILDTVNAPDPRAFHASCIIYVTLEAPVLAVFGGFTFNRELVSNDLYILNLSVYPLVWDVFKTSGPVPSSRYGHSLSYVGSHLVLFGGTNGVELFNDLWSLNINYGTYITPGKHSSNQWTKLSLSSLVPSPRAFHACCKAGISSNSPMVIYGGLTESEPLRNRIYALHNINEDLIWNIVPTYTKCPSELRIFHSMTFIDNMFVITGGEGYINENVNNVKSLLYSLDCKVFQYIEDSIDLSGHASWSAYGMIYHWGGLKNENGILRFDDSISVSNPLAYSDDRNIEEIYYKYIRYTSFNNVHDEFRDYTEPMKVENDIKDEVDIDFNVNEVVLFDTGEMEDIEFQKPSVLNDSSPGDQQDRSDKTQSSSSSTPSSEIKVDGSLVTGTPLHYGEQSSNTEPDNSQHTESKSSEAPYQSRPRRSAAIKCLTAIELDNIRHRDQERLNENSGN